MGDVRPSGKVSRLSQFFWHSFHEFRARLASHGLRSALIFARVRAANFYARQRNKGTSRRVHCPCCGWGGHAFFDLDVKSFWLPSVVCPQCDAQERQRMLRLYIERHDGDVPQRSGVCMHFAPEEHIGSLFRDTPELVYFGSEYEYYQAMLRCPKGCGFVGDLQRLGVQSGSVDIAICVHVLEHVRDDRASIAEIYRVLRPGGIAYIMVPFDMKLDATEEWDEPDPDIYGHIWAYSRFDFKDRLGDFEVTEIKPETFLGADEQRKFGVPEKEIIYRCTKR